MAEWRTPIHADFAGPAVSGGRVFITDFQKSAGMRGTERARALDEKSGKILWTHEGPADYKGIGYGTGPRAKPTVDGDRVYIVGGTGTLLCLNGNAGLGHHERSVDRWAARDRPDASRTRRLWRLTR